MLRRKTEEDYHKLAKSRGFKWVGESLPKYVKDKTLWRCKKLHTWKAIYNNINSGYGCPYCSKLARKTEKDYNNLAKSRGFKWLGKILPKNNKTKTWWKCEKGHRWGTSYASIYRGYGCHFCSRLAKKTKEDYLKLAKIHSIMWIETKLPYNTCTKTTWMCRKGHVWKATYGNTYGGSSCPRCGNRINGTLTSKPQIKLNNLLYGSLNYPEGRYRIDVAIMRRSQKIAVEYDCQYWHEGNEKHDAERDIFLVFRGWKVLHIKSRNSIPKRKQLNIAINYLVDTNNSLYNIYLEDWKI